jgi:hypothetical protein
MEDDELLRIAGESGIDVFRPGDSTFSYEQNLAGRKLAIVALTGTQLPIMWKHLPKIITVIDTGFFPNDGLRNI